MIVMISALSFAAYHGLISASEPTGNSVIQQVSSQLERWWTNIDNVSLHYKRTTIVSPSLAASMREFSGLPIVRRVVWEGQWTKCGQRFLNKERIVSPKPITTGQDRIIAFDGNRYLLVAPQRSAETPVIANVATTPPLHFRSLSYQLPNSLLLLNEGDSWGQTLKSVKASVQQEAQTDKFNRLIVISFSKKLASGSWIWRIKVLGGEQCQIQSVEVYDDTHQLRQQAVVEGWIRLKSGVMIPRKVLRKSFTSSKETEGNAPCITETIEVVGITEGAQLPGNFIEMLLSGLPKGSELLDLDTGEMKFVGFEPTDSDVKLLVEECKKFLAGKVKFERVTQVLPPKKRIAQRRWCGAYSLLILCYYFGVDAKVEELVKMTKTDEKGITSLQRLVEAALAKGLKAGAYKLTLSELTLEGNPVIVHLKTNHFAVVLRTEADEVILIDPPTALTKVPTSYFKSIWSGNALLVR